MVPSLRSETTASRLMVSLSGAWVSGNARLCQRLIDGVSVRSGQKILLRDAGLLQMDVTGAWLLQRFVEVSEAHGAVVQLEGFSPERREFLARVGQLQDPSDGVGMDTSLRLDHRMALNQLAEGTVGRLLRGLDFVGLLLFGLWQSICQPARLRGKAIIKQCEASGVRAAPIVALISFLIAIVLAYQGASQLRRFGAEIFTIDLVAISVLREMGVLLTAIMVAGRSGSAFAAEIGTMKLNQELDALHSIGVSPMEMLLIPRVLALTLMMPLLGFLANMMGLSGAALLTVMTSDTSLALYFSRLSEAIRLQDFWVGMIKAPVFGMIIAMVGCYHGMAVTNSAESVGRETTRAVVGAIFWVIFADALFSILFTELGV